jgi:hypothetical protein
VKLVRIEGERHLDHAAGGLLRLFVVLIEGIANVAELAFDAQRCRYELHRRNQLVRRNALQRLQILKLWLRRLLLRVHQCLSWPNFAKEKRKHPGQGQDHNTRRSENASAPVTHSVNWSPWTAIL